MYVGLALRPCIFFVIVEREKRSIPTGTNMMTFRTRVHANSIEEAHAGALAFGAVLLLQ
jgi:hypothetical protein